MWKGVNVHALRCHAIFWENKGGGGAVVGCICCTICVENIGHTQNNGAVLV
jgi:hypothetical protein